MSVLTRPDVVSTDSVRRSGRSSASGLKRAIDFFGATVGLILLLPGLALIGFLVAVTSPGGALYRQTRVGLDGQLFSMVKFRTMRWC